MSRQELNFMRDDPFHLTLLAASWTHNNFSSLHLRAEGGCNATHPAVQEGGGKRFCAHMLRHARTHKRMCAAPQNKKFYLTLPPPPPANDLWGEGRGKNYMFNLSVMCTRVRARAEESYKSYTAQGRRAQLFAQLL